MTFFPFATSVTVSMVTWPYFGDSGIPRLPLQLPRSCCTLMSLELFSGFTQPWHVCTRTDTYTGTFCLPFTDQKKYTSSPKKQWPFLAMLYIMFIYSLELIETTFSFHLTLVIATQRLWCLVLLKVSKAVLALSVFKKKKNFWFYPFFSQFGSQSHPYFFK